MNKKLALIITGVRRCGKSTLMRQIMRSQKKYSYMNFEDIRLAEFGVNDLIKLKEIFDVNKVPLFFDEIQNINKWELFIRTILEENRAVHITGSNATLMSRELGTKLTGRYLRYELFPFSYGEFLKFKKLNDNVKNLDIYLQLGGFPEFLKEYDTLVLQTLLDDILVRDIIVRFKIRNAESLRSAALYFISNTGREVTLSAAAKLLGIKSKNTVQQYLSHLENSYLVFSVPMFSFSIKKQIRNPKKIYTIDNGLLKALSLSYSPDKGQLLENLVFLTLRKKYNGIYYFKKNRECDFVLKEGIHITRAYQVCYKLNNDNKTREFDGLSEAMDNFNLNKGTIITFSQEDNVIYNGKKINIVPLRKFLSDF